MSAWVGDTEVDKRGQTDVYANFSSKEESASSSISAITKVTSDSLVASDVNNNSTGLEWPDCWSKDQIRSLHISQLGPYI